MTLADICEKYKLWLHVDGAYCGAVIFSEKNRHLLKEDENDQIHLVSMPTKCWEHL